MIGPSLAFVGTFSAIFIALGLLGQQALRGTLTGATAPQVCGAIIIVMGLLFVLSPLIPRLAREWHVQSLMERAGRVRPGAHRRRLRGRLDPLQRPDARRDHRRHRHSRAALYKGAFLLAIYCAGLGVPFLLTGLAFGKATAAFNVVKRHYPIVIGVGGVVLIGMGVLIWTGQFAVLNQHVSNWLQTLGLPNFNSRHLAASPGADRRAARPQGTSALTPSNTRYSLARYESGRTQGTPRRADPRGRRPASRCMATR